MRELCRRTNKEYTKYCLAYSLFQSPSPVWRTTPHCGYCGPLLRYFNPRPPCGGRLTTAPPVTVALSFQSPSSVWRTTQYKPRHASFLRISIHVLRVEDDRSRRTPMVYHRHFNPRPPCGGRQGHPRRSSPGTYFNPRPPCGGRPRAAGNHTAQQRFQSTSSVWRTTGCKVFRQCHRYISIHVLRVEDDNCSRIKR